jgi:uncharacterized membrane protein YGL010W
MRSAAEWLHEYGVSHRNATNAIIHCICVPLIVLSLLGLLWSVRVPHAFAITSPWLNWATVTAIAALIYYFVLAPGLAIGVGIAFALMLPVVQWLASLPWPLWTSSLAIFAVAWVGQFIGHSLEGRRPAFFEDLQFLLIGPLWLIMKLYGRLGLKY